MSLIDQIITAITETDEKTSSILRRCLVLAYRLKNDDLKAWASKELNGYRRDDPDLPGYRRVPAQAKGFFLDAIGQQLNDQPLAPGLLKPEHQHFAEIALLVQPVVAYEHVAPDATLSLPWPANLTVLYQNRYYGDDFALNRAWQSLPGSCFVSIVDTVRTRLLTLLLELRGQAIEEAVEVEALPRSTVQTLVQMTVIGGNNVFGNVEKFAAQTVHVGDLESLKGTLAALGVGHEELDALQADLEADQQNAPDDMSPGKRTMEWVARNAKAAGKGAVKIGADVTKELITEAIKRYLGGN